MTGFPQTILPIKVELLLNGTWTDITAYVYSRDPIVITRGRPDETQQIQPGSLTLTLNNRDFRFSPKYTSSPYYPYLVRNVQVRVSVVNVSSTQSVTYNGYRFWGEVASWPPSWDLSGKDIYVQIHAGGILRRYVQGRLLGSALRRFYMLKTDATAPIAYWPCEEGSGAAQFANLIVAGDDLVWTSPAPTLASDSNFAGSDPLPLVSKSAWTAPTSSFSSGGSTTYSTPGTYTFTAPGGVGTVTASCWGAGGGGGGYEDCASAASSGDVAGGSGGGGGEYESASVAVTAGNNYTVIVGSGGSGGTSMQGNTTNGIPGASGGDSSFTGDSVTVTARGGTGGLSSPQFPGAGGSNVVVRLFTSSGSWTAPTGVTSVKAECWGAGAGNAGSPQPNGGNTTFPGDSVTVTAHGGTANTGSSTGGAGGTGSTNTTHHDGGAGGNAGTASGGGGGSGGTAGAGNAGSSSGTGAAAVAGGGPGGGGGATGVIIPFGVQGDLPGGGYGGTSGSGGGGGGEYAAEATLAVTAGHTYSYTVGAGGAGSLGFLAGGGLIRLTYTVTAATTHFNGAAGGIGTASSTGGGGGGASSAGTAAGGNAGGNASGSTGGAGGTAPSGGGAGGAGGDYSSCVDTLTEIFTRRGWLRYDEVTEADDTLAINTETGDPEWTHIEKVNIHEGDWEMTQVTGPDLSVCVNAEHRWLIREGDSWVYKRTSELTDADRFPLGDRTLVRYGACEKKRVQVSGTIWCPTTGLGNWLARRNGTGYYIGNKPQ